MRQDEQISRYEVNRNVRMVISRHDVDLTKLDYSFMGSTVYLNGDLARPDGDFTVKEIEIIIREISALPHVRDIHFDLNNWIVVSSGDSWQVNRVKKAAGAKKTAQQTGSSEDSTFVIEKAEDLQDVLDDLETGKKGK